MYWVGQKVHSGFSYSGTENLNELFGQPNAYKDIHCYIASIFSNGFSKEEIK